MRGSAEHRQRMRIQSLPVVCAAARAGSGNAQHNESSRQSQPKCNLSRLTARHLARHVHASQQGNALVETALVLPLLLSLAFGIVGVGRVTHSQLAVSAVAREAARAAALANTPTGALAAGVARGQDAAAGYGIADASLRLVIDVSAFARRGTVRATASYDVGLGDLPLMGWVRVPVSSTQVELIDPYRSRWPGGA